MGVIPHKESSMADQVAHITLELAVTIKVHPVSLPRILAIDEISHIEPDGSTIEVSSLTNDPVVTNIIDQIYYAFQGRIKHGDIVLDKVYFDLE